MANEYPAEQVLATLDELERIRPEWSKEALALYDQGAHDVEVMRELGLSPASWDVLMSSDDLAFNQLVTFGNMLSHAWWLTQGRTNLQERSFNTPLYNFQMKNRFNWTEKTEQAVSTLEYKEKSVAELKEDIAAMLNELEAEAAEG